MPKLSISVPPELFAPAESSHFEGIWDLPVFSSGPDLYSFQAPLQWQVDVSNVGDAFLVIGTVEGTATTGCGRCLEPMEVPIVGEVEGYFLIEPDALPPEEMEGDECSVLPDTNEIDLEPLLTQALLLDLPLLPLCDDECEGLCPQCGANLNRGQCDCAAADEGAARNLAESGIDPTNPFAVLLDMDFDKE